MKVVTLCTYNVKEAHCLPKLWGSIHLQVRMLQGAMFQSTKTASGSNYAMQDYACVDNRLLLGAT